MLVMHSLYECERCGGAVGAFAAETHNSFCKNRGATCKYCQAIVAQQELVNHEQRCGHMKRPCPYCDQMIVSNTLDTHCATSHGMNPSFGLPDPQEWRAQHDPSLRAQTAAVHQDNGMHGAEFEALYRAQLAAQGIDENEEPDIAMCIRMSLEMTMQASRGAGTGAATHTANAMDQEDNRFNFNDEQAAAAAAYQPDVQAQFHAAGHPCPVCGQVFDEWELDEHLDLCLASQ